MKKKFIHVLLPMALFACLGLVSCNKSTSKKKTTSSFSSEHVAPTSSPTSVATTSSPSSIVSTSSNPSVVSVTGVTLDDHELSLSFGSEHTLKATVSPENATNQQVSWSSSNVEIATVRNGRVIANNIPGQATITVTTNDGSHTDTCLVTVADTEVAVTGVNIPYDYVNVELGKSVTIAKNIEPSNAKNQAVSWSSSNTSVATISDSGTVTPVSAGTSTITVTTADGGFTDTCLLTVLDDDVDPAEQYVPDSTDASIKIINESVISETTPNDDGEYEFSIEGEWKQIYVNAPDAVVILNLNGTTITNSENSPIYVAASDKVEISAKKNTTNTINDTRSVYTEDQTGQGKGAIYVVDGDLKFKGTGSLSINAGYYNGVHGKDDVKLQKLTLNITAIHHGIKANDSFSMESGTVSITCGGDGIHTDNSNISSSSGNQRGDIIITGGSITINSWCDAIQAAHDVNISGDTTVLDLKTNKYSSYSGTVLPPSETSLYLKMNSTTYSSGNYTYAAYINGEWYKAAYKGTQDTMGGGGGGPQWAPPGGGGGTGGIYYIYEIEKPADAESFVLYRFSGSNVTSFSTTNYNAKSSSTAFNADRDMVTVSVSGTTLSVGSWSTYTKSNSDVADISAKGIKCENEIYISAGTMTIKTYDDGIHANNDGLLENGETPLGNVYISGGSITIDASDDGIHADYILDISGGEINVTYAYEGLEGNVINISGGSSYVKGKDDGVNASSGPQTTPAINISGGLLDVEVSPSGDTDGIDSNGTITITGGTVIAKGPGSASGSSGGGSFAVDSDGATRISGGTLIVFGGIESMTSYTGTTKTVCSSSTVSKGSHSVSFQSGETVYTTTLNYSFSGCVVYSSLGTATLS